MKTWLLAIPFAGALIAACSSNTAHDNGTGGSGGSSAGSTGTGLAGSGGSSSTGSAGSVGGAGAAAGGATGQGGASGGGAGGTSSSGGGAAGTSSGGGGAAGTSSGGGGGAAGTSSGGGGAAGTSSGGRGGSGVAGQAGSAGSTGAAGAGGGLPDGTAQFDLTVTSGGQSNHITSCVPSTTVPYRVTAYPNGQRFGNLYCRPESQGPLYVYDVGITIFPEAVGTHDASEVKLTCDILVGGCFGVGTVVTTFKTGTTNVEITSFGADSKSGTFTLDEFTADGHVAGSMDLTMSEGAYTVRITGRFKASLHDCGPITNPQYDPCTGSSG